ncbi:MAG TPA: hypothetical protein VMM18_18255 [Gemmatimonadaceae bacterium]|nr:hypothetical protein [Gemmatimonadaceae bacterium]
MRRYVLWGLVIGASFLSHTSAAAQQPAAPGQPAQPGVVIVSSNKCAFDAPSRLDSLNALAFYPVLDELVREGRLMGWGVLTHAWGDEWNYVVYYTAASTPAFHGAWDELVRRLRQRRPNFMADVTAQCTEHKDNIYGVMRVGAPPPAPR